MLKYSPRAKHFDQKIFVPKFVKIQKTDGTDLQFYSLFAGIKAKVKMVLGAGKHCTHLQLMINGGPSCIKANLPQYSVN
jgi:hypothetical protein